MTCDNSVPLLPQRVHGRVSRRSRSTLAAAQASAGALSLRVARTAAHDLVASRSGFVRSSARCAH